MAPFTPKSPSKLRSALHFRYSIVILCFIPIANTVCFNNSKLNPNIDYNGGFEYNHNHCIVNIHYKLVRVCDIIVTTKMKGL